MNAGCWMKRKKKKKLLYSIQNNIANCSKRKKVWDALHVGHFLSQYITILWILSGGNVDGNITVNIFQGWGGVGIFLWDHSNYSGYDGR